MSYADVGISEHRLGGLDVVVSQFRRTASGAALSLCLWVGNHAGAAPIDIEVMTQNLYVGADATPVLQNPSPATITAAYNSLLRQ